MKKRICQLLKNPKNLMIATLALSALAFSQGYSDETQASIGQFNEAMNAQTSNVNKILFGSGIRKAALTLAGGAGLFQAFMSSSIRPLLIWGGLGLCIFYLPAVINLMAG